MGLLCSESQGREAHDVDRLDQFDASEAPNKGLDMLSLKVRIQSLVARPLLDKSKPKESIFNCAS